MASSRSPHHNIYRLLELPPPPHHHHYYHHYYTSTSIKVTKTAPPRLPSQTAVWVGDRSVIGLTNQHQGLGDCRPCKVTKPFILPSFPPPYLSSFVPSSFPEANLTSPELPSLLYEALFLMIISTWKAFYLSFILSIRSCIYEYFEQ